MAETKWWYARSLDAKSWAAASSRDNALERGGEEFQGDAFWVAQGGASATSPTSFESVAHDPDFVSDGEQAYADKYLRSVLSDPVNLVPDDSDTSV